MKVLVACEFSGIVRDAFIAQGHDAWSCDLLPTERPGPQGDVLPVLADGWDLLIAHPPCTYLAGCGARWIVERNEWAQQRAALQFVRKLLAAPIPRIAVENPVGKISSEIRQPDQYIQPWQFGHGETKKTGLWLVQGRLGRVHREPPSPDRWKNRSRTYQGIAAAMASQWGSAVSLAEVV